VPAPTCDASYYGERVHAVVVARGPGVAEGDLKRFSATQLSDYKAPDTVGFVDALPRNAYGKVAGPRCPAARALRSLSSST
jgi:non-ribosomal peptide synthetase component E (peptide arylation enzyme)